MGVNTISATRKVKTNAVTPDGSFEIRDAKDSYSGQIVTARIAAQISAGKEVRSGPQRCDDERKRERDACGEPRAGVKWQRLPIVGIPVAFPLRPARNG